MNPLAPVMRRSWPVVLLLLSLLQPRTAAAEVWAYGWTDPYTLSSSSRAEAEPRVIILPADDLEPGGSTGKATEHPDRLPQGPALRPAPRPRFGSTWTGRPVLVSSGDDGWTPLCERLPYHATAPPPVATPV